MSRRLLLAMATTLLAGAAAAQAIIAQPVGITNPTRSIDFGAGLYPNFTPITTQFAGVSVTHARYYTTGLANNLAGGFLTNDFSSQPDTVALRFPSPLTDISFVYQQIGTNGSSTIRALLDGVVVSSFSGSWDQYQTDNYFGFSNSMFDEVQIDFVVDFNIDSLELVEAARCVVHNGSGVNPVDCACVTRPVLGSTWQGHIVTNPATVLTLLVFAPAGLKSPQPFFGGELLIHASPPPIGFSGFSGYSLALPASPAWLGTVLMAQGFRVENPGNTLAVVPLNALELVLAY